jgi:hypothetical protein
VHLYSSVGRSLSDVDPFLTDGPDDLIESLICFLPIAASMLSLVCTSPRSPSSGLCFSEFAYFTSSSRFGTFSLSLLALVCVCVLKAPPTQGLDSACLTLYGLFYCELF